MKYQNNVQINTLKCFIFVTFLLEISGAHKILVVFPNPARSHGNLGDGLVRHLLKAGHQVTYITPFVKNTQQNLTYVDVSVTSKIFEGNPFSIEKLTKKSSNLGQDSAFHIMKNIAELALYDDNVKNFLEDTKQTFDLVIAEWMFNELYSGFAAVFNCPYMWVFPFEPNFIATSLIDEPTNPAYVIHLEFDSVPPFTFVERVSHLLFQIIYRLKHYYYYSPIEKAVYESIFGPILLKKHGKIVPYEILRHNASLLLSYSHFSLGQAISIPQNLIPVGGYHVEDEPVPLPEDLKTIMDNAKEGVIYFSMGSNLKTTSFPESFLRDLIKVFSEIKYTVLFKFEGNTIEHSDNVHIVKWAPQQSILAHPNCILFITHGGLLSTIEAVHNGVPIVGIPVFYDQFSNMNKAIDRGFAKKVSLNATFDKDLKAAILDILSVVRYARKAKELSFVYHHRPLSPGDEVIHWVHHVVATQGAPHLRSPAFLVPWYQKLYLDLVAVVFLLFYIMWYLNKLVVNFIRYRIHILRKKNL